MCLLFYGFLSLFYLIHILFRPPIVLYLLWISKKFSKISFLFNTVTDLQTFTIQTDLLIDPPRQEKRFSFMRQTRGIMPRVWSLVLLFQPQVNMPHVTHREHTQANLSISQRLRTYSQALRLRRSAFHFIPTSRRPFYRHRQSRKQLNSTSIPAGPVAFLPLPIKNHPSVVQPW